MPGTLTIFVAKDLIFIDIVLAVVLLAYLLWRRSFADLLRVVVVALITLVLAYVFAKIGAHVYSDPRPFTQDHVKPLISHAPDNGFPSDHALLGAAIVAIVLLLSWQWALLFAVIVFLIDWARVGAGIHHVLDVAASSVFVALAFGIALLVAPPIVAVLAPRLPWSGGVGARPTAPSSPLRR